MYFIYDVTTKMPARVNFIKHAYNIIQQIKPYLQKAKTISNAELLVCCLFGLTKCTIETSLINFLNKKNCVTSNKVNLNQQ